MELSSSQNTMREMLLAMANDRSNDLRVLDRMRIRSHLLFRSKDHQAEFCDMLGEAFASQSLEDAETMKSFATVAKIGDGSIIKWIIEHPEQVAAFIKIIMALFGV